MLNGPMWGPSMTATRPATRSDTNWKERVCWPSPYTVMGLSVSACATKLLTTRPSSRAIRGPYVLKIRTMRTCGEGAVRLFL